MNRRPPQPKLGTDGAAVLIGGALLAVAARLTTWWSESAAAPPGGAAPDLPEPAEWVRTRWSLSPQWRRGDAVAWQNNRPGKGGRPTGAT